MAELSRYAQFLISNGLEKAEAQLIARAIALSSNQQRLVSLDIPALRSVRRTFFSGQTTGKDFRAYHTLVNRELQQLTPAELAFGDIPDWVREQHSGFCFTMHQGHQQRYLDRHEDETVNEFLDRPNKAVLNVTKLVIKILSQLYHKPPMREFAVKEGEPDYLAQAHLQERLTEIWANKLFNRTMIDVDKFTRLLGTVAVRPIYDPELPGRIRLWLFMSHQLRVIPDPTRPWRPAAVIERVHPFADPERNDRLNVNIWTDRYVVNMTGREVQVEEHQLGRIPHVFVREELSYNSFFVEGRGRILCDPNAILNNDLSDYEEIKQLQGFGVGECVNPEQDNIRLSPRTMTTYRVANNTTPFGINFKNPGAPLAELRVALEAQVKQILMVNNVPVAALGAEIDRRGISGEAIRAAMQPITNDLEERERIFEPAEVAIADSMLRVVARHEPGFAYQEPETVQTEDGEEFTRWVVPEARRVEFGVTYQPLTFPMSTRDQIQQDDFDISQGMETPASIMRRRDPDKFPTHEEAVEQWRENLAEMRTAGFSEIANQDAGEVRASYGGGVDPLSNHPDTPILNMLEGAGLFELA